MLKLEDFVSETLKQIISGVKAAQSHAEDNGAHINPTNLRFRAAQGQIKMWDHDTGAIAQEVDFDVAVTTTEGTQTKGGVGIFVGPVGLGTQGQSDANNQSVSRIKFSVPILLPGYKT